VSDDHPEERLLTTAQAAKILGVSARTLARYAEQGQLTPTVVLPSGHYRWAMTDIRRQLRELRERTSEEDA
jgi:predicted site-specific integrase-resolvase